MSAGRDTLSSGVSRSWASSQGVRKSMVSNRGRDTVLEVRLRSALHRRGLRFWKHRRPLSELRCEADVLFPRLRLAVFVNGCFWHACPEHATWPATNREFWKAKIEGNRRRDALQDEVLVGAGWTVLRLWEHQSIPEMAESVATAVERLRRSSSNEVAPPVARRASRRSIDTRRREHTQSRS